MAPGSIRRTLLADPDDDYVLACALAANADWIVSGDRHLLNLKHYHGMRIIDAAERLCGRSRSKLQRRHSAVARVVT